jgi:hypothetical protein
VYAAVRGDGPATLVMIAGAAGVAFVLAALLAAWDDGLTVGPVLLLLGYVVSLADGDTELDRAAPLFGVGLLAVVEFGAWSLELRDGAEERPLARLPRLAVLLAAAAAVSTIVLAFSSLRIHAGMALWALGAAAAIGLLLLMAPGVTSSKRIDTAE